MSVDLRLRKLPHGKAWQRSIREIKQKELEDKLTFYKAIDLNLKHARVKRISKFIARKIVLEYEWLGTMGNSQVHFGIFFENYCGGAVCYQVGNAGSNVFGYKGYGIGLGELGYLVRGACVFWTPKGAASKLIARSLGLIKKQHPNLKVIVAYADEQAGEIGTVYQATNWVYLGKGIESKRIISPTGHTYDLPLLTKDIRERSGHLFSHTEIEKKLLSERWKLLSPNPKHRYCFILADGSDREKIFSKIQTKIKPYPKRCGSGVNSSTSTSQVEGGGANPTEPLQLSGAKA
jgi:hypothetical protein